MATEKKIYNTPLMRYRLGTIFIWLGVLTWVPFIVMRIAGEKPLLFWYLPFHLLGVIGGARLLSSARKELGILPFKKKLLQMLGHGMIFLGILAWAPFFYMKLILQQSVDVTDYLPFHLSGVL